MKIFVESDLILKRSFPGSFAIFSVSEGVPKYFGNVDFSWKIWYKSTFPKYFGFPSETQNIAKDPGNERFRMRSDSTKKFMEKYLKTKGLEHFSWKLWFSLFWSDTDRSNSIKSMPVRSQLATRYAFVLHLLITSGISTSETVENSFSTLHYKII